MADRTVNFDVLKTSAIASEDKSSHPGRPGSYSPCNAPSIINQMYEPSRYGFLGLFVLIALSILIFPVLKKLIFRSSIVHKFSNPG